ncbi:unnamed protein product, partial [Ixodes pacificus]
MFRPMKKQPYPIQTQIVQTILEAASKREHVMIESPTGSGKSLALINAASQWITLHPTSKVYYCSRTHQQLEQITNTIREVDPNIRTVRLVGKEKLCLYNTPAGGNMAKVCKWIKSTHCCYFKNLGKTQPPVQSDPILDVEDLVTKCSELQICPYYTNNSFVKDANIILSPYNYILDASIRKVDLHDSLIIIDEAHNIESVCRDSLSFEISITSLQSYKMQASKNSYMYNFFNKLITMYEKFKEIACKNKYYIITGTAYLSTLTKQVSLANIPQFPHNRILNQFIEKFQQHVSNLNNFNADCFRLVVEADLFRIICLDPQHAMKSVVEVARTIVLASETLSPFNSYEAELGINFKHKITGNHVVHPENVYIRRISHSIDGKISFRMTYGAYNDKTVLSAIGQLLLKICESIKVNEQCKLGGCGVLCFFPSYQSMLKCAQVWKNINPDVWTSLMATTNGCIYFESNDETVHSHVEFVACGEVSILCAVHRGRISEGMDFADNLARVVVSIGIPFPSIVQDDVRLKMEFNDTTKPQVLNGREWYRIQAMRAVNQAVGRCIRHSKDWGAMLLVDQRFLQCDTWKDMCNWIKVMEN